MANLIFEDLIIETGDMISDPDAFSSRVIEAAELLKNTMKKNDSVETYLKAIKPVVSSEIPKVKELIEGIYNIGESVPIEEMDSIITYVKALAKDLDTLKWYRAGNNIANEQGLMDKRTAHEQYIRLRESYNSYVDSLEVLELHSGLPKLPAMPGNYGSSVGLKSYIFFFDGEDEGFRSHIAVCRRLKIESRNLMDTLDYVKENPDCKVTVKVISS